jgi:hypothetical protein
MKKINISDELHDKLKTYSFLNKMTMKEVITMSIERLLLTDPSSKVVKGTSSKVVNTTNVLDDLDWTDKEAQDLIEPSILEKFNI